METIDFEKLITEIAKGVQESQFLLERTQVKNFMGYFSEENGCLAANTKEVLVSYNECGESKKGRFAVPIATLASHNGLSMDRVEVTIRTNLIADRDKIAAVLNHREKQEGQLQENAADEQPNSCEIKLVFGSREPADGIKETVDLLNKTF